MRVYRIYTVSCLCFVVTDTELAQVAIGSDCTKPRLKNVHRVCGMTGTLLASDTGMEMNQVHAKYAFVWCVQDLETGTAISDTTTFARNLLVTFMLLLTLTLCFHYIYFVY